MKLASVTHLPRFYFSQVSVKSSWAKREISVAVTTQNGTGNTGTGNTGTGNCSDLTLTWKVDWETAYGLCKNLTKKFSTFNF